MGFEERIITLLYAFTPQALCVLPIQPLREPDVMEEAHQVNGRAAQARQPEWSKERTDS